MVFKAGFTVYYIWHTAKLGPPNLHTIGIYDTGLNHSVNYIWYYVKVGSPVYKLYTADILGSSCLYIVYDSGLNWAHPVYILYT